MNTERTPYPKIELHVHLEATIAARDAARDREAQRRDASRGHGRGAARALPLPRLRPLHRGLDPDHELPAHARTDFRQVVVDYAAEAKRHGAVYLEAIFSPIERTWRGVSWDEIFSGYCDGAQEARELHGVEVLLTPGHHPQRAARGRAHARPPRRRATATAGSSPSGSAARRRATRTRRSRPRSAPPARQASARSRTRARSSAPSRSAARSTCSSPTASATASARSRTRRSSASSPTAASSST